MIINFYRQIWLVDWQLWTNFEYYWLIDYVFDDRLWSTCYVLLSLSCDRLLANYNYYVLLLVTLPNLNSTNWKVPCMQSRVALIFPRSAINQRILKMLAESFLFSDLYLGKIKATVLAGKMEKPGCSSIMVCYWCHSRWGCLRKTRKWSDWGQSCVAGLLQFVSKYFWSPLLSCS